MAVGYELLKAVFRKHCMRSSQEKTMVAPAHSKRPLGEEEIAVNQMTMAPEAREQKAKSQCIASEAPEAGKGAHGVAGVLGDICNWLAQLGSARIMKLTSWI